MQKIIVACLLAISANCLSYQVAPRVPQVAVRLDASSSNIPAAYDTTAGSQIYSNLGGVTSVAIHNDTAAEVCAYFAGVTCDSVVTDHVCIGAGSSWGDGNLVVNKVICLRGFAGVVNTGIVRVYAR